jgi:hypothetical protein
MLEKLKKICYNQEKYKVFQRECYVYLDIIGNDYGRFELF